MTTWNHWKEEISCIFYQLLRWKRKHFLLAMATSRIRFYRT